MREGHLVPDGYQWWYNGELYECCRGEIVMRTEGSTTPKNPEISSYLTTTEEQTTSSFEVLISNFNSAVSSSSFVTSTLSLESNGCDNIVGSSPLVVKKNNVLRSGSKALPVWGPEFEVRFELKVNSWSSDWGSIFRFSSLTGDEGGKIGQRIPAMWTRAGTTDQLYIATNIDSNGDRVFYNELGKFQPGTWYSFVISQRKDSNGHFYFDVAISGVRLVHIKNNTPRQFENVEVYAGDKYYHPADAELRYFQACH